MNKKLGLATMCLAVGMMVTGCCGTETAETTTAAAGTDTAGKTDTAANNTTNTASNNMGMGNMNAGMATGNTGQTTTATDNHNDGGTSNESSMPGMTMDADGHMHMEANDNVKGDFKFANPLTAKKDEKLTIVLSHTDTGKPIKDFEAEHTKLMHLIVVSKDLSYFNHIHPEYLGFGKFEITTQVPSGGDYEFIADTVPKGEAKSTLKNWIFADGKEAPPVPLTVDTNMTKVVDGMEITLSFDKPLKAEDELKLTYHIVDAATKKPITDLEPYLGAVGHTVIIDQTAEQYVHVHPSDEEARGPDAVFETTFPGKGKFKVWTQFQHGGKVSTVSYVVEVKE
ncbi:MAG: hypothetical protein WCC10_04590 [Tumebacillaceae bacterium]